MGLPDRLGQSALRLGLSVSALAFWLLMAAPTWGATIELRHAGSTDPITEGWSAVVPEPGSVGPVNDGGIDAWFTDDNTTTSGVGYLHDFTPDEIAFLSSAGWTMSANMRMVDGIPGGKVPAEMLFTTGGRGYALLWGFDFDNVPYIQLGTGRTATFTTFSGPLFRIDPGYHQFDMIFDPQSSSADVYLDNVLLLSGYTGISSPVNGGVFWGMGGSVQTGEAYFRSVLFQSNDTPVSAPHSFVLLLLGFTLAALRLRYFPRIQSGNTERFGPTKTIRSVAP